MSTSTIRTLQASTTTSVDGTSASKKLPIKDLAVSIDLSVLTGLIGGTPTVDFEVEWSPDGVNFGAADGTADTFAQMLATGVKSKQFTAKGPFHRLKWTIGGNVSEIQSIVHDHTGGTFALSFDGEGPTAVIDWNAPNVSVSAQGTLTMDTKPSSGTAAQGTLTLDTQPTDLDIMTVDGKTYTFLDALTANEIQSVYNQATGGTFTLSFDGQGPTGVLPYNAPDASTFAEGTLTLDTEPTGELASQGTLTLAVEPTDADTFTIDSKAYIFQTALTDVDGNVAIGGSLASAQANLEAAIDLSGTAGVDYATSMTAHTTVTMANFAANAAVLTAVTPGTAGDTIATTSTFFSGSNLFDGVTLGTTTAGVDGDTYTVDAKVYTFQTTLTDVDGNVNIGGSLAQAKLNLVAAMDLSGAAGTDYATSMAAHGTVDIAAFTVNDAVLTAKTAGTAGNALATTETFAAGTNIFDAGTLGTTTTALNGIETELELFSNITNVGITGAGTIGDPWLITFTAPGATDVAMLTADDALLTGGTPTSVIAEDTKGVADADGVIVIGGSLAQAKLNLVAAFDLSGVAGTDYATAMTAHTTVDIAAFIVNDAILTAKSTGTAGNALVSTSTFFTGTNQFDATTLGTTTAGLDNDTVTIGASTYTWQDTLTDVDGNIFIGANIAASKLNLVAAMDLSGTAGTDYALSMTANVDATMAAFIADDAILTAISNVAVTGNAVTTTETFVTGTNIFDAGTLGTTTAGVNGLETELEKFTNIGDLTVVRNGNGDWDVTFAPGTGDRVLITIDDALLTGGASAVVTTTQTAAVTVATFIAKEIAT